PAVDLCAAALSTQDGLDPCDVIAGSAGTLAAMLAVHEATGLDAALRVAADGGLAWPSPAANGAYLAGFSHGAAGIGWALTRYAAVSGEARYAHLAGK